MLQLLHKYRIIFLVILVAASFFLVFSDLVVSFTQGSRGSSRAVITVNQHEYSYDDYIRTRRLIDASYRQMLGDRYQEFIRIDLNDQAIDRLISEALLEDLAADFGLVADDKAVSQELAKQFASSPDARARYNDFLAAVGMSAPQFESSLRKTLIREQITKILEDAAFSSLREAHAALLAEMTRYDLQYLVFEAKAATGEEAAGKIDENEIKLFYEENATDFELPPQVSYDYVVFEPKDALALVEVFPEDIELYYSDHEQEFMKPEEARFSVILFSDNPEASAVSGSAPAKPTLSPIQKELLRKRAQETLDKLNSGDPQNGPAPAFEELARIHSADALTSSNGGDAGFLTKQDLTRRYNAAVASKAFALADGAVSAPLEIGDGFLLIKREESMASELRPLEQVRLQIEQKIREREAPAFSSNKAHETLETLIKLKQELAVFAAEHKLALHSSAGLVSAEQDPVLTANQETGITSRQLSGLSKQVIEQAADKRFVIELGEKSVLVEVKEFRDASIPNLADIRPKIVERILRKQAKDSARRAAEEFLAAAKAEEQLSFEKLAEKRKLKLQTLEAVDRRSPGEPLSFDQAKKAISEAIALVQSKASSSAPKENAPPENSPENIVSSVLEAGDKFYIVRIAAIKPPTEEELQKRLKDGLEQQHMKANQVLTRSIITQLKAQSKIDVDQGLYSGN